MHQLLKQSATLLECLGDDVSALHALEHGMRLSGSSVGATDDDLLHQFDLLAHLLRAPSRQKMPPSVVEALAAEQVRSHGRDWLKTIVDFLNQLGSSAEPCTADLAPARALGFCPTITAVLSHRLGCTPMA
jgi:hypothetical protein